MLNTVIAVAMWALLIILDAAVLLSVMLLVFAIALASGVGSIYESILLVLVAIFELVLLPVVLIPLPIFLLMRYVFLALYENRFAVVRYTSPLFTIFVAAAALYAVGDSRLTDFIVHEEGVWYAESALAAALAPVLTVTIPIIFLFIVKVLFEIVRYIALAIFQSASSPTVSPFSYAAALLGVLIVGTKLVQQLLAN